MEAEAINPGWLGFVTFTIVVGSLSLIILSAILVKPRKSKVTLVVIGSILTLFVAYVSAFFIGGLFLSIFIP